MVNKDQWCAWIYQRVVEGTMTLYHKNVVRLISPINSRVLRLESPIRLESTGYI